MADTSLTTKQQQALDVFKDGGNVKDVAKTLGISQAGAYSHVTALRKKGYIDGDGRLTSLAVGKSTGNGASAPPEAPEEAPAETPEATANGRDHESFVVDQAIAEQFAQRRQEIATTIAAIEDGIAAHEERSKALEAERAEHESSVTTLKLSLTQARKALDALPDVEAAAAA